MAILNQIFKKYGLFIINDIEIDFQISNIKAIELLNLIKEIYPVIHTNSKLTFGNMSKKFLTEKEIDMLIDEKKQSGEHFDIIGEIGVNIFNETKKCDQFLKYTKLADNVNNLIKKNVDELQFVFDLLNLNCNNKIILMFITNGDFDFFLKEKDHYFLKIQKLLNIDSLLIYKSKKKMFRGLVLEKLVKNYRKKSEKDFKNILNKKFHNIIEKSLNIRKYEKVSFKLDKIAKKLRSIKRYLYNYLIKNKTFQNICSKIMDSISEGIENISLNEFEKIKKEYFNKFLPQTNINIKKMYHIIFNDKYKDEKDKIIKKYNNIKAVNDLDELKIEKKKNILNIIILFVDDINNFLINNIPKINQYIGNGKIDNSFPIYYYFPDTVDDKTPNNIVNFESILKIQFKQFKDMESTDKNISKILEGIKDTFTNSIKIEMFYKFIIKEYNNLFKKTIYSDEINRKTEKNEILFMKISQDLQFYQTFNYDGKITLKEKTKILINNITNNGNISELVDGFINESNLLNEIRETLIEFEERITKKKESNNILKNTTNNNNKINYNTNINNNNELNFNIDEVQLKKNNILSEQIEECEKYFEKIKENLGENNDKEKLEKSEQYKEKKIKFDNFLILTEEIKKNIITNLKNEIPLIIYMTIQNSIKQYFEIVFNRSNI